MIHIYIQQEGSDITVDVEGITPTETEAESQMAYLLMKAAREMAASGLTVAEQFARA